MCFTVSATFKLRQQHFSKIWFFQMWISILRLCWVIEYVWAAQTVLLNISFDTIISSLPSKSVVVLNWRIFKPCELVLSHLIYPRRWYHCVNLNFPRRWQEDDIFFCKSQLSHLALSSLCGGFLLHLLWGRKGGFLHSLHFFMRLIHGAFCILPANNSDLKRPKWCYIDNWLQKSLTLHTFTSSSIRLNIIIISHSISIILAVFWSIWSPTGKVSSFICPERQKISAQLKVNFR